ncbi:MAG: hypothetical protein NTZ93_03320 [Candidatus Beckwithbacteria bacterium]|nr:hypothetical protein [Candidatus Beckwithbacteria bacterium]
MATICERPCPLPKWARNKCPQSPNNLHSCLKKVNEHIEPGMTLGDLKKLIMPADSPTPQVPPLEHFVSLSELLADETISRYEIESLEILSDQKKQPAACLLKFKNGREMIFRL